MNKKVLILSGSPRKDGNSDLLCNEFAKGAAEAGHQVEKIRVAEKKIGYCRACYACKETGIRAIQDDMAEVMQKMTVADGDAPAYQETLALAAEDFSFYRGRPQGCSSSWEWATLRSCMPPLLTLTMRPSSPKAWSF